MAVEQHSTLRAHTFLLVIIPLCPLGMGMDSSSWDLAEEANALSHLFLASCLSRQLFWLPRPLHMAGLN